MSGTDTHVDHLKLLADNRPFVLGAYFVAFVPWALVNNIDFISEKWRTIRRTRQLGRMHLICSILPVFYLAVYAEAQRRSDDSKELGAALVAFCINVYNFLRTLFGNVQVDAFERWASDLANCMRAIRIDSELPLGELVLLKGDDEGNNIDDVLMVNNSVVDNELGGRDVTVKFSPKKVWAGLKQGRLVPSEWLVTDNVGLSTVRWSSAFLCGLGEDWYCYVNLETMNKFFSFRMSEIREFLSYTTWTIIEGEVDVEDEADNDESNENRAFSDGSSKNRMTLRSIRELNESFGSDIGTSACIAFGTNLPFSQFTLDSYLAYSFDFDSLCASFPIDEKNPWTTMRESIVVNFVYQLLLVKHLGVKNLTQIRQCYEHGKFLTGQAWEAALKLLLEQRNESNCLEDEEMAVMFSELEQIPIFPYRRQMIVLWDECSNRRVLQASVHCDNFFAIKDHLEPAEVMSEVQEFCGDQMDVYEYYKDIGGVFKLHYRYNVMYGIVAESVRSFLAEWLVSSGREPNWEPLVPLEYELEFRVSEYVSVDELDEWRTERLMWECQRALQNEVARTYRGHENLPSSAPLMMLFISAFPQVDIREIVNVDDGGRDEGVEKSRSNTNTDTVSSPHTEVNVSERKLRLWTEFVPSDITVLIRQNLTTRQATLKLVSACHGVHFIWEEWVNAMVGMMKGMVLMEEKEEEKVRKTGILPLQKANLREPMLELCPLHVSRADDTLVHSGIARVWTGWPPFDWRVCKFEVDEWLYALELDSPYPEDSADWVRSINGEVENAAQVVKSIMQALTTEK